MPTWTKPVTLVPNTNENTNDLNAILDDIYARANGGLDETNVPNLTAAFTSYKLVSPPFMAVLNAGAVAGTYSLGTSVLTNTAFVTVMTTAHTIYFPPTLFTANARNVKYRLLTAVVSNLTPPAVTFTPSMQGITAITGAGTPTVNGASLVAGSNAGTVSGLGAGTFLVADSGDFTAPTAALYAFVVSTNAALAANASVTVTAQLYMRQV